MSRTFLNFGITLENRNLHRIAPLQGLSHEMQLCVAARYLVKENAIMLLTMLVLDSDVDCLIFLKGRQSTNFALYFCVFQSWFPAVEDSKPHA